MSDKTYYHILSEWHLTEYEYGCEFYEFIEKEFDKLYSYMQTNDFCGRFNEPNVGDMGRVLKKWQENHTPINYKVTRFKSSCINHCI